MALMIYHFASFSPQGVTFPAMYAMIARWAPPYERTRMLVFTMCGASFGTIVATPVAGVLCDSNFLQGWPSVFYIFGKYFHH